MLKPDRIRVIAKSMAIGAWSPIMHAECQEKWGVGDSTMNRDVAEASRLARGAVASDAELLEDLRSVARGRLALIAKRVESSWAKNDHRVAVGLEKSAAEYLRILLTDTRGKGKGSQKEDERAMSIPVDELRVLLAASGYELRKVDDEDPS